MSLKNEIAKLLKESDNKKKFYRKITMKQNRLKKQLKQASAWQRRQLKKELKRLRKAKRLDF